MNDNTVNKKRDVKNYLLGLLISFIVTIVVSGMAFLFQLIGKPSFPEDLLKLLSNAFFVGGVLVASFYILVILSSHGAYDLLTYSVKLVWYTTFYKNIRHTKLAASYADYREEKRGKPKVNVSFMIVGSAPFIIAGIILALIFAANH